jgi:hypothetical protein
MTFLHLSLFLGLVNFLAPASTCPHPAFSSKHLCFTCKDELDAGEFTWNVRMKSSEGYPLNEKEGTNYFTVNTVQYSANGVPVIFDQMSREATKGMSSISEPICRNRFGLTSTNVFKNYKFENGRVTELRLRMSTRGHTCFVEHSFETGHLISHSCEMNDPVVVLEERSFQPPPPFQQNAALPIAGEMGIPKAGRGAGKKDKSTAEFYNSTVLEECDGKAALRGGEQIKEVTGGLFDGQENAPP